MYVCIEVCVYVGVCMFVCMCMKVCAYERVKDFNMDHFDTSVLSDECKRAQYIQTVWRYLLHTKSEAATAMCSGNREAIKIKKTI